MPEACPRLMVWAPALLDHQPRPVLDLPETFLYYRMVLSARGGRRYTGGGKSSASEVAVAEYYQELLAAPLRNLQHTASWIRT